MMDSQFELLKSYPWLPSLNEHRSDLASKDPIDFINYIFSPGLREDLRVRVLSFFKAAFENLETTDAFQSDDTNILLYLTIRILLYVINNPTITNRMANLYSKVAYSKLNEEGDYNLYYVYKDLDLEIIYDEKGWEYGRHGVGELQQALVAKFKIFFIDYLKLYANMRDEYRKLVNNPLSEGYVFIEAKNLNRLIQEYVRKRFLTLKNKNGKEVESFKNKIMENQEFKEIHDIILAQWEIKKGDFEYTFEVGFKEGSDLSSKFPPCIKEILSKAKEGENLNHNERLYLVFFLHALNYPIEKVVDVFSTLPDFDRDKTLYQVEFAKKKGYTPHKCDSLKALGLCSAKKYKEKLCLEGYFSKVHDTQKQLSHPLFYVQYMQFRAEAMKARESRNQSESKDKGEKAKQNE